MRLVSLATRSQTTRKVRQAQFLSDLKSMGIDANDFARAFIIALGNDDVINKLDSTIWQHLNMNLQTLTTATQDLKRELDTFHTSNYVGELRELVKKKNDRIKALEG